MPLRIFEDMTERDQLEAELYQAQKWESVGRLAAGVAHEINTPIQFVGDNISFLAMAVNDLLGLAEQLQNTLDKTRAGTATEADFDRVADAATDADLEYLRGNVPRAIAATMDGVKRVATIVRSMKAFGHPDQGEKTAADLNVALQNTLTVAMSELKYVAEIETSYGDLPLVRCHLSDLNQVFLNLLVNAAHAIADVVGESGSKGRIGVSTHLDGDTVVVAIADSGVGIAREIQDKVFDLFFTTKAPGKGTGQGLALAHAVVVGKHGGTITFTSELNKGTTFFIRLPLGQEPRVAADEGEADGMGGEA
jgi:signal transduction histidine kinase